MATRYMLDTNIASALITRRVDLDERLQALDADDWCISAITRAELMFGVLRRPAATRLARLVKVFLEVARCEAFDDQAADRYAALRAEVERRGSTIGMADEMIAAHALSIGATVVTDNLRHFGRVPGLPVENWLRA